MAVFSSPAPLQRRSSRENIAHGPNCSSLQDRLTLVPPCSDLERNWDTPEQIKAMEEESEVNRKADELKMRKDLAMSGFKAPSVYGRAALESSTDVEAGGAETSRVSLILLILSMTGMNEQFASREEVAEEKFKAEEDMYKVFPRSRCFAMGHYSSADTPL